MTVSVFVTIWAAGASSAELDERFRGEPLSYLKSSSDVLSVEFYTPEPGDVPVLDDVPAPTLIVQIDFESAEPAAALVRANEFRKLFTSKEGFNPAAEKINLEVVEAVHFDIPGRETPPPRTAPLSFVVRYYGPVRDAGDFAKFYMENHPPIVARFPNIRNVLCYLPLGWRDMGEVTDESLVIGNEVVFDDLASLKGALATEITEEAIADSQRFESFGYSSHHAMHREMVYRKRTREIP